VRLRWKIGIALAGGALANLAVAWACAAWSRSSPQDVVFKFDSQDQLGDVQLPPEWLQPPPPPPPFASQPDTGLDFLGEGTRLSVTCIERSGFGASAIECFVNRDPVSALVNRLYDDHEFKRVRVGWPLRALEGVATLDGASRSGWALTAMVALPHWLQPRSAPPQMDPLSAHITSVGGRTHLPLRVLPLAFACDTLVFAVVVFIMVTWPGMAVRRWRSLRMRCPSCAYDMRGLAADAHCPECGAE
jgi:hypothetical protein